MKILKEKSRTYKGVSYYKYKINIPEVVLNRAKLKEGDELEADIGEGTITLKRRDN